MSYPHSIKPEYELVLQLQKYLINRYNELMKIIFFLALIFTNAHALVSPISDSLVLKVSKFDGTITPVTIQTRTSLENARHLIIDLQDNPGGNLHDAVAFGALFVTQNALIEFTQDNGHPLLITRPLDHPFMAVNSIIILINNGTASAAEAAAAILKHHPNHIIIGQPSHGKTSIQSQPPQPYEAINIQKIMPDVFLDGRHLEKEALYLKALQTAQE